MLEMLSQNNKRGKQARRLIFLMQNVAQCYPPTPHLEREGSERKWMLFKWSDQFQHNIVIYQIWLIHEIYRHWYIRWSMVESRRRHLVFPCVPCISSQHPRKIAFPQKFCLTKVELTFGREGSMWTCKFRRAKTDEHEIKMHQDISGGRVRILRPSNFSGNVTGLSEICLCPDFPLAGPLLPPAANLTSVKVIGKNTLEQYASDIVNSLSTELFVASN